MKFFLSAFLSLGLASATLPIYGHPKNNIPKVDNIAADSDLGSKIMANARRLEENDEIDFTWVSGYSIKFQGCHHVSQWNSNVDDDNDVRIATKRLIRFRLCPTDSCSARSGSGCSSAYGDYVIDMHTFLESYYQAVDNYNEYRCEYTAQMMCECNGDDGKGDDFNQEVCKYECFAKYNMLETCNVQNPYNDDQQKDQERFDLANYVGCQQVNFQQQNNNNDNNNNNNDNNKNNGQRRLEEGQQQQQMEYFVGPYCAEQGGAIYLGLFTDDSCSEYADSNAGIPTYKQLAGESLPYSRKSIITMDCLSCKEPEDFNYDGNDAQDADDVMEMCEQIYDKAGKCETALKATGIVYEANENACNYISGIKVVRKDGIITQVGSKANKTASIFIGIFVVAFVLLAAYVYYLKTKLDRASINLSD